jgi:hypothetical protein
VAPDECDFTARMPTQPIIKSRPVGDAGGGRYYSFDSMTEEPRVVFTIFCSDLPPPIARATDERKRELLVESISQRTDTTPKDLRHVQQDGYPGIEYSIPLGSGTLWYRAYIVDGKLYELDVGDVDGDARHLAGRFFRSFSIR